MNQSGGAVQTNLTVQTVISGDVSLGVTARGQPTGYYRKKALWKNILTNDFNGVDGGKVGRRFGSTTTEYDSPYTSELMHWTAYTGAFTMDAVMDGRFHNGYVWKFRRWLRINEEFAGNTAKILSVAINKNTPTPPWTYTAKFVRQFDISFQNSFNGVGNAGAMKINGVTESLPHSSFVVYQDQNTITAEALYNVVNGIEYIFNQWDDGSTQASRTFNPSNHESHTAYFNAGIPLNIRDYFGLTQTAGVGQYVRLQWNEHINTNVTQYHIWRQVKQGGTTYGPYLVATLNRGTTLWTDNEYLITNGYTDLLLLYDVRAYYAIDNTFANPAYLTLFGTGSGIGNASKIGLGNDKTPTSFSLKNYPNPFNPSTKISFELPEDGNATLAVYDALGRKVAEIANGFLPAGSYSTSWSANINTNALSSGIYLLRMKVADALGKTKFSKVNKLMLMR